MNEDSLRAILRDPSYPRELRDAAFRCIVRHLPNIELRIAAARSAVRRLSALAYTADAVVRKGICDQ